MNLNFDKSNGLIPAIIQDAQTLEVLMLGYMNKDAYASTIKEKKVTFYSRSKKRLWTKGEKSNNYLKVIKIQKDCDNDTLLIKVKAMGPVCHSGNRSCFKTAYNQNFIFELENIIDNRFTNPDKNSYVKQLRKNGLNNIIQKVGEESVEVVIAAKEKNKSLLINETSDLIFHLLVLLKEKNLSLKDVANCLKERHKKKEKSI